MLGLIEDMPEKTNRKVKEEIRKVVRGIKQREENSNDTPQILKKESYLYDVYSFIPNGSPNKKLPNDLNTPESNLPTNNSTGTKQQTLNGESSQPSDFRVNVVHHNH